MSALDYVHTAITLLLLIAVIYLLVKDSHVPFDFKVNSKDKTLSIGNTTVSIARI